MKTLGQILANAPGVDPTFLKANERLEVSSLTNDSREVSKGAVFFAYRGLQIDGHDFIEDAVQRGAVAVIGENELDGKLPIPYSRVPEMRAVLATAAAQFYDHPSKSLTVIGVTGTSGKTTTTYVLESIFKAAGRNVGVIGTVNFRYGGSVVSATHTTPHAIRIQGLLREMKERGCDTVVMEVSSHALKQKRATSILFDGVIFTNLSSEHLDYHPDMEDYFETKKLLFTELITIARAGGKSPVGVVATDSSYGERLFREVESDFENCARVHLPQVISFSADGIQGDVAGVEVDSKLIGRFNAWNLLVSISLAKEMGIETKAIEKGVRDLKAVPGRLERVGTSGPRVWVDYAHKPDALEKVLVELGRLKAAGRLITVFGCGGDRDRSKRPEMGRIAVQYSDLVIVTSDNPRTEEPQAIIDEILTGIEGGKYEVEPDREKAIVRALDVAQKGDCVLIAGKGHETYQIIRDPQNPNKTIKIDFDDRVVVNSVLGEP